jgi:hypothetical protein
VCRYPPFPLLPVYASRVALREERSLSEWAVESKTNKSTLTGGGSASLCHCAAVLSFWRRRCALKRSRDDTNAWNNSDDNRPSIISHGVDPSCVVATESARAFLYVYRHGFCCCCCGASHNAAELFVPLRLSPPSRKTPSTLSSSPLLFCCCTQPLTLCFRLPTCCITVQR